MSLYHKKTVSPAKPHSPNIEKRLLKRPNHHVPGTVTFVITYCRLANSKRPRQLVCSKEATKHPGAKATCRLAFLTSRVIVRSSLAALCQLLSISSFLKRLTCIAIEPPHAQ